MVVKIEGDIRTEEQSKDYNEELLVSEDTTFESCVLLKESRYN